MARKKTPGLTDAELRLMQVLGPGRRRNGDRRRPTLVRGCSPRLAWLAYSTVLTTLRILENKGYLKHTKQGRAFVYQPVIGRDQAREKAVSHLLRRFFEGSPEQLVLNLIQAKKITPRSSRGCESGSRSFMNHADFFSQFRPGVDSSYRVLVTGPSRTADIEKTLVLGVHGPQRWYVVMTA